jgi:predicted Zn-dependent peptidase
LAECGVEKENIEKAKDEILVQLGKMKSGDFTDTEMEHALLSLQNDLKMVGDSLAGIKTWYLHQIYRCAVFSPEDMIERYLKITREQIVKAAQSVTLDTVYVLTDGGDTK